MTSLHQIALKSVLANTSNANFFKASTFHGDKKYKIINFKGKSYFQVKTDKTVSHYKLIGSTIGAYTTID
jgi:hypothetical protein